MCVLTPLTFESDGRKGNPELERKRNLLGGRGYKPRKQDLLLDRKRKVEIDGKETNIKKTAIAKEILIIRGQGYRKKNQSFMMDRRPQTRIKT